MSLCITKKSMYIVFGNVIHTTIAQCLFRSVKFHLERIVGMTVSLLH